jgi:hypothetical protein
LGTEKIREQIEKINALSSLQKDLLRVENELSDKDLELVKTKLAVIREEMLKATYAIGKLLKEIEEKV